MDATRKHTLPRYLHSKVIKDTRAVKYVNICFVRKGGLDLSRISRMSSVGRDSDFRAGLLKIQDAYTIGNLASLPACLAFRGQ
eukprot:9492252-Pyramimonas_sp.AAC.1